MTKPILRAPTPETMPPSVFLAPLHHGDGASSGFDWVDAAVILAVLAVLAGAGFGLWYLIQRRRYG